MKKGLPRTISLSALLLEHGSEDGKKELNQKDAMEFVNFRYLFGDRRGVKW